MKVGTRILRLAAFCLALPMLSGCQRPNTETVLRIGTWGGAGDEGPFERQVREIIADFERQHPGVRVQMEATPSSEYVQKMLLNHVAGTMPDVMVVDASSAAVFMDNGILMDLTSYANQTPSEDGSPSFLGQYWENVAETFQRGDKVYAIPNDFTPMVMYYNKALFDAAGVAYPRPGWSFDEFRAIAKQLTIPKQDQYGFFFTNWMPGWVMWIWNGGGDILNPEGTLSSGTLDSPSNAATIGFLRDLVKVDRSAPSFSQAAAYGVDLFASGRSAMTVSGHWSMIGYKSAPKKPDGRPEIDWKQVGVVEMPSRTGTSSTVLYMSGYGVSAKAKHPDLAWDFVKLWTGKRVQTAYNATGIAVCGRKDVSYARANDPQDPVEPQFLPIIAQGRPPEGSRVEGYQIVEKVGQSMMDSVLINGTDPQVALTNAAKRIDREFAKRL